MVSTIDRVDREIIRALEEDGRMPLVQLADRIGLSVTPCKRRLARLEESGLISGYCSADRSQDCGIWHHRFCLGRAGAARR